MLASSNVSSYQAFATHVCIALPHALWQEIQYVAGESAAIEALEMHLQR